MKKGLLKVLSVVMAISMLLCMSMVAFAEGQTYNVVTTYDGANVTVTTTVENAAPSEQVAFLVEKDSNIVWIDQKAANESGSASSVFTATEAAAVGATVKVGTSSLAASTFGAEKTITLPSYTVTWNVVGSANSKVIAVAGGADDDDGTVATSNKVTFYVFPAADAVLESVSYGEVVDTTFIENSKEYSVTANTDFTFTFATKATPTEDPVVAAAPAVTEPDVEAATPTASVAATATNATEYGILVAADGYDFSQVETLDGLSTTSDTVRKYHALGANAAGQFVIQLADTNGVFFVDGAKYDACVYAYGTVLELGASFDLN